MRLTIPKSQGKQPYYDARKSNWGDLFPHKPKNKPIERYQSVHAKYDNTTDIGKRKSRFDNNQGGVSYEKLGADIKDRKKREKMQRLRRRDRLDDIE
jgi:ribosomal protein RSM22 (predicted rRNA methylase)